MQFMLGQVLTTTILASAILGTSARGQTVVDESTVVVTGRGLRADQADAAYDVTIIGRDRIAQSASGRLEDVLRDVGGLQGFRRSDSRSANATSQSITLRGLGGNASSRALLILDGVPQNDPFGGWVSFPAISTSRIGRIKVTRGAGSSLFGPGALAGTVELDSATPDQLAPLEFAGAYGSRHSVDARGSGALSTRNTFLTLSGAFMHGDGFVPIIGENRGPIDRPARYKQASGAARAAVSLGATTELQANLDVFDDQRDRGLPFTANRGKGADGSLRLVGKGPVGWSLLGYAQRRRFASQSASVNAARSTATLTNDQYEVPSRGYGARGEIIPLAGTVALRLGADLRAVDGETREYYQYVAGVATRRRVAGGRAITVGGFADATVVKGAMTANLSARIDHWRISRGNLFEGTLAGATLTDTDFADRNGVQPTGRAALAYDVGGGLTARVSAYRGWRLATLNELYRPFRAGADATAANAGLKPETLTGAEVGADWQWAPKTKASATIFTGRLHNAIANVTVAPGPGTFPGVGFVVAGGSYRRRENLEQIRSRGFELGLDAARGAFATHFAYSFVDARVGDQGLGRALDGKRPAQTPQHQASATVSYSGPHDLGVSVTGRAFSRQYEDDLNTRTLRGAATLDAAAELPLSRRVRIGVRGENLFDTRVEATISSDGVIERALPRTLWLELRLK
jgi:outer membrane receptor protein involved in Fe transport